MNRDECCAHKSKWLISKFTRPRTLHFQFFITFTSSCQRNVNTKTKIHVNKCEESSARNMWRRNERRYQKCSAEYITSLQWHFHFILHNFISSNVPTGNCFQTNWQWYCVELRILWKANLYCGTKNNTLRPFNIKYLL